MISTVCIPSLKKNSSFRAFAVDLQTVLRELTTLGVLTREQRVKRARVGDANDENVQERRRTYFKLQFDINNNDQKSFLESYQVIYPGEIFYS